MSPTTDTTAARIRAELGRRRLPDTALCEVLGLSRSGVSRRLLGHTDWTVGQVLAVARFLELDPRSLIPDGMSSAA